MVSLKICFVILLTFYHCEFFVVAENDTANNAVVTASLMEDLKIMKIKLRALTTQHELDVTALKKDVQRMKKEFVDILSGRNENNPQGDLFNNESNEINSDRVTKELSSFEWAHKAIDDIHGDMAMMDEKLSEVKSDLSLTKEANNKTESFEGEAKDKLEYLMHGFALAKARADMLEKNNIRLWKRIKFLETRNALSKKNMEDLLLKVLDVQHLPYDGSQVKLRHNRQLRNELHELKSSFWKINNDNANTFDQIVMLKKRLDSFQSTENRLAVLENVHNTNNKKTDSEIVKLHSSMLELLESVEAQEARMDKVISEYQNQFSKLDIEVAQLNSHYSYMKSTQNTIRESVKAIAVSVSNVIQKIDEDRALMEKINKSTVHLEHQSKLHFNRLTDHISKSEAQQAQNTTIYDGDYVPEILDKMKEMQEEYEDILSHLPTSCDSIKEKSGVHQIKPKGGSVIQTYCSDGWTLMQARFDGSVDFNRNFKEYSEGFGNPNGEYWIGNDALHTITKDNCTMLRIEMLDITDNSWIANYENIRIAPKSGGYRLTVNGFTGNASDALEYQNNMEFSTTDHDHDISNTNCAADYEGGWWFSHCQHANLNGKFTLGLTWFDSRTNQWIAIKSSRMMIKTNPRCVTQ